MSSTPYDPKEQDVIAEEFAKLLRSATKDGAVKRAKGDKVPWDVDPTHYEHAENHIRAYQEGHLVDPDSGAHPLVHAAWRFLAVAYQDNRDLSEDEEWLQRQLKNAYF